MHALKGFAVLLFFSVVLLGCGEPSLSDAALSLSDDSPVFSRAAILSTSFIKQRLDAGLDPNVRNTDPAGDALLTYVVRNNAIDTVDLLLRRGADVSIRSKMTKKTPLFQAAFDGRFEISWLLIDAGADPNASDDFGNNALREAILGKRPRLVRLLLRSGADPLQKNADGQTMADIAVNEGPREIAQLFQADK
ncbi:ankyrin repeat domain-containing protein [Stieleria varia]|nr:ankyrin repeat domain-containing protein [Stieleria varia]